MKQKSSSSFRKISEDAPRPVSPSQETIDRALDILFHLLSTNRASDLLRAIPAYDRPIKDEGTEPSGNSLSYNAARITSSRHCWEILSPGFAQSYGYDLTLNSTEPVSEYAWGVLEWLILGFEKERSLCGGKSPSLASQLPPCSAGPRTMMDIPLGIVFAAFSRPTDLRKLTTGQRLMNLMISLTRESPPALSAERLVSETARRLRIKPSENVSAFLSALDDPPFEMTLCCIYLAQYGQRMTTPSSRTSASIPRRLENMSGSHINKNQAYPILQADTVFVVLGLDALIEDLPDGGEDDEGTEGFPISAEEQAQKHAMMKVQLLKAIHQLGLFDKEVSWKEISAIGKLRDSLLTGMRYKTLSDGARTAALSTALAYVDIISQGRS
ncbi:hypothetical protein FRC17_001174 [Serendipita sp. 399]|nr:hypothetical protein FRC17_001174 [Serendipita sp. 399]